MSRATIALLCFAAVVGLMACGPDDGESSADGGPVHNNTNGYCWSRPNDCYDLIPVREDMHYQCCFSKYGYYCDTDEVLHEIVCDYACSYDAEADEIYCAELPDAGPCQAGSLP